MGSATDFHSRAKVALAALRGSALLEAAVKADVDSFFEAHPEEPRTKWAEDIITVLVMERLQAGAETQAVA